MVDPLELERLLIILRRNGVAAYKSGQLELVLEAQTPTEPMQINEEVEDRGVAEIDMAYAHLGYNPEKAFGRKG